MTAYLRGVDIGNLTEKYFAGQFTTFATQTPVAITKTITTQPVVISNSKVALKPYEFMSDTGKKFSYIGYRAKECGKYGEVVPGTPAKCMYCLRDVDPSIAIGIPIAKQQGIYHCIDIFHWYSCALAELRRRIKYNNMLYEHSMIYLGEMYELTTGKSFDTCKASPDNRLLQIFNGDMTYEDFDACQIVPRPDTLYFYPVIQTTDISPV